MKGDLLLNLIAKGRHKGSEKVELGTAHLSRIIGVPQSTIWNYIQLLYLEPETQEVIGRDGVPYTYARVVARLYPEHMEAKREVERLLRQGYFKTRTELEQYVNSRLTSTQAPPTRLPETKPAPPKEYHSAVTKLTPTELDAVKAVTKQEVVEEVREDSASTAARYGCARDIIGCSSSLYSQ